MLTVDHRSGKLFPAHCSHPHTLGRGADRTALAKVNVTAPMR
ncbi:hypothetical protein [Couchioplanes caeruleus]|nr:hypothetical protein [Couchioplanes caeruleus]